MAVLTLEEYTAAISSHRFSMNKEKVVLTQIFLHLSLICPEVAESLEGIQHEICVLCWMLFVSLGFSGSTAV